MSIRKCHYGHERQLALIGKLEATPFPYSATLHTGYALIDDKRGRRVPKINQIKTIGSLGVLLQAKRAGNIPLIAPLLEQISSSPVYISESLI